MAKRIFLGLSIPAKELPEIIMGRKKLLISADKRRIEVQWSRFENYHVTLKFLGDINGKRLSDIVAKSKEVASRHEALKLKLSGVGAFPDEDQARVLWLGCQNSRALRSLQADLEEEMTKLGFSAEERDFKPHITVGRIRKTRNVRDMISPLVRKNFGTLLAKHLIVYESQMRGYTPIYTPLEKLPLKA